jgi:hypothetical protein
MKKTEVIEKIKTKIKNFLRDDFNNWYVRLCCLCFSLALMISSVVTIFELIYVSFKHMEYINEHLGAGILISVIMIAFSLLQIWISKLFYKLYDKIKTYLTNV